MKFWMYAKGYATVSGFVLVGLADGLMAMGWVPELAPALHQVGLGLGSFGTVRKAVAGV